MSRLVYASARAAIAIFPANARAIAPRCHGGARWTRGCWNRTPCFGGRLWSRRWRNSAFSAPRSWTVLAGRRARASPPPARPTRRAARTGPPRAVTVGPGPAPLRPMDASPSRRRASRSLRRPATSITERRSRSPRGAPPLGPGLRHDRLRVGRHELPLLREDLPILDEREAVCERLRVLREQPLLDHGPLVHEERAEPRRDEEHARANHGGA